MPATEADKRHHGWHKRRHFWTPETRAKVDGFLRRHPGIPRYAARRACREFPGVDYDDMLSEGMYALARCAASYEPGRASFVTYAFPAVCHTVRQRAVRQLNARRSRGVPTVTLMPHDGAKRGGIPNDLIDKEDAAWAMGMIRKLPTRSRLIVQGRLDGVNYGDIARLAGVAPMSAANVRLVYSRAVKRLGAAWRAREERCG